MGPTQDHSGRVANAFGLAYHRLLADLVPGVALALVLLALFPSIRTPLAGDGPLGAALVLAAALLVLASGLAINFLGFTFFWPRIRRLEQRFDMWPRTRAIFGVDAIRARYGLEGDAWWRVVDACEDLVLTRHPAWFEPYAHVDGMRKMVRGLAVVALLAALALVVALLPAPSWGALAWLCLGLAGLVAGAGGLLFYSAWMSGYYHAAIVQAVHLNCLVQGSDELDRLVEAYARPGPRRTLAPEPAAVSAPPR